MAVALASAATAFVAASLAAVSVKEKCNIMTTTQTVSGLKGLSWNLTVEHHL